MKEEIMLQIAITKSGEKGRRKEVHKKSGEFRVVIVREK